MIVKATPGPGMLGKSVRRFGPFDDPMAEHLASQLALQGGWLTVEVADEPMEPEPVGEIHVHVRGADADEILRRLGRRSARA